MVASDSIYLLCDASQIDEESLQIQRFIVTSKTRIGFTNQFCKFFEKNLIRYPATQKSSAQSVIVQNKSSQRSYLLSRNWVVALNQRGSRKIFPTEIESSRIRLDILQHKNRQDKAFLFKANHRSALACFEEFEK
jgi:hypothetical protein